METLLQDLLAWKGLVVAAWLLALFLAERVRPAALPAPPRPGEPAGGWRRLLRNGGLWSLTVLLSVLVVLPLTWWAAEHALDWRPAWWRGAGGLLLDLLLLDLLIYWWHRANHEWPPLWRFHQVHHLDRFLDTTSALRFHAGEVLLSACARALVVLLLGFPFVSILVFETLVLMAAAFHHSNLRLPARLEGALAGIVITPSIHWVHHHARRSDTDSNYGTILSIWDPLFGTRSPTARALDMPIGVEGGHEKDLLGLLVRPFARARPRPGGMPPAQPRARE
jgi:sterol desaturase/sphingolipid hydroxylase (fatty acid hydroxylase superfamily)